MAAEALQLWFDFSCPYAYLASQRAEALGVEIDWRPMLLGGVFRGSGAGDGPMATLSPQKAAHNLRDMHRWAERFGAPFAMPAAHPMRTVRALRVLLGLPRADWPRAIHALFAAYWQRGEDVTSDHVIHNALARAEVGAAAISVAFNRVESEAIKDELRARTDEALALGVFGAPAWVLPGSHALVWGQDRLPWVEAGLAGWAIDSGAAPPGGARCTDVPAAARGAAMDVYFDVSSPFAYFALTQLDAFVRAGVRVRLAPILLGALFKAIGQRDVPLFAMPQAKQKYVGLETYRWARWWGVPFAWPKKFPQRTQNPQRLVILAAQHGDGAAALPLAVALGRAMWAEQRDLEDAAALRDVLAAQGLPAEWVERTQEPAVKAALAEHTAEAQRAGAFGVPTFVVGKHLFWGQDRLDLVAAALAGWEPRDPI